MRIHLVVATRPNIIKIARLYKVLSTDHKVDIIHTGQHFDSEMDAIFFHQFNLPRPTVNFGINKLSNTIQVNLIIQEYSNYIKKNRPDLIVSIGDCNASPASAFVGKLHNIKVAHLEAGLRSLDMDMPEENNRIVTDALADRLWCPSDDALLNVDVDKAVNVGNIMCDTIDMMMDKILDRDFPLKGYGFVTLHRPSNVDTPKLKKIIEVLNKVESTLICPKHPRTTIEKSNMVILPPQGYINNLAMIRNASFVITDSGGIQEETTYLNVPCLTLRDNTERPITITEGTNKLTTVDTLLHDIDNIEERPYKPIKNWDGKTSERILEDICGLK